MAAKAAPGDGRSGRSMWRRSAVEEGDGLLEQRRLKELAVVDDVAARGRQLVAGGTVARSKRRLCSLDRGVAAKEQRWLWTEMATEKFTMENRRLASPDSAGKRDKGNRVGRTRIRQVAAVGWQCRCEVVGSGRAAVSHARPATGRRVKRCLTQTSGPWPLFDFFQDFQHPKFEI
jgi:hypothetical protein